MTESIGKALESAIKDGGAAAPGRSGRHVFGNPHRRDVFSALTRTPFVGAPTIASGLGLSGKTVRWHLDALVKAGYVIGHSMGKYIVFFPEGLVGREDAVLFLTVNRPRHGAIYRRLVLEPGLSQSELAASCGESRQAVARALSRMAGEGLLTVVEDGTRSRYYPTRLLADRAEAFLKRSRDFSEYILRKLESEGGSPPVVVKRGLASILVEMGHARDRFAMEVGINPFMTCGPG